MCPVTEGQLEPALNVQGVTFGYVPQRPVVRDLSAPLRGGRITALVGPNAAGKSTLLRLMLGHLSPWRGRIALAGVSVGELSARRRARMVSYVPQRASVSFSFTVMQVVAMGRHALGPDEQAVGAAIEQCDLNDLRERVFAQLSVGQQQRVLLARALAQAGGERPGVAMLLDEPSSAMDPWHVHRTMGLLRRKADEGLAILVVLHDLNLAARYANDVWLLDAGRLVAAGPWQEVLRPSVLEPIYRVRCQPLLAPGGERPVFLIEPHQPL